MDINLPGIKRHRGDPPDRRRRSGRQGRAVSTYAAEDLPEDARSCGAAGYIGKADLTPRLLRELLAD